MPCCAAVNCSEKPRPARTEEEKKNRVSFHRFPKRDLELYQLWLYNLRRDNFTPSKSSSVCSKHFEEQYIHRLGAVITLKRGAIPTIFDYPPHLQDHIIHSKPEPSSLESSPNVSITDQNDDSNDIDILKRKYDMDVQNLQKKLETSQEKIKKYKKKVQNLENALKSLHGTRSAVPKPTVKILSKSRKIIQAPV